MTQKEKMGEQHRRGVGGVGGPEGGGPGSNTES